MRERGNRYIERARSLSGCIQERSKDITTIDDRERERERSSVCVSVSASMTDKQKSLRENKIGMYDREKIYNLFRGRFT